MVQEGTTRMCAGVRVSMECRNIGILEHALD